MFHPFNKTRVWISRTLKTEHKHPHLRVTTPVMVLPTWNCVGKKGTLCLPPTTGCFPPGAEQVTASALALGTWHIMFSGNEHQNTDTHIEKLGKTQEEEKRKQRRYNII